VNRQGSSRPRHECFRLSAPVAATAGPRIGRSHCRAACAGRCGCGTASGCRSRERRRSGGRARRAESHDPRAGSTRSSSGGVAGARRAHRRKATGGRGSTGAELEPRRPGMRSDRERAGAAPCSRGARRGAWAHGEERNDPRNSRPVGRRSSGSADRGRRAPRRLLGRRFRRRAQHVTRRGAPSRSGRRGRLGRAGCGGTAVPGSPGHPAGGPAGNRRRVIARDGLAAPCRRPRGAQEAGPTSGMGAVAGVSSRVTLHSLDGGSRWDAARIRWRNASS
jgi:hypothetical protein